MTVVTLFKLESLPSKLEVIYRLDSEKRNGVWFQAKQSRYNENEVQVDVWYEEDLEIGMKRVFSEEAYEMVEYMREKGKEKVIRKVYCFIDLNLGTLEIYRGVDWITNKIKQLIEDLLQTTLNPISLSSGQLLKIVKEHSLELKQAMFKYIHGLWYHIIRGRHLEDNGKYNDYLGAKPDSLRTVSITPKIKYLNGTKYMVTINGDKGTIRMSNGLVKWRPRLEIKQIVSFVVSAAGLTSF